MTFLPDRAICAHRDLVCGFCSSPRISFPSNTKSLMVKKVVRRAEVKGHRHGFRVSDVLLIEAADNPRPVHKLCHQTQHPKQDHHLESPRTRIVHALEVSETSCAEKLRDR